MGAGMTTDALRSMLDRCQIRINGMQKLITDLLDLTSIESRQKKRALKEIDIRKIAETAIETIPPDVERRDIKINLFAKKQILIHGDNSEIEIIFNNLISNALKYHRDGGTVEAILNRENNHI